jgi:hypothetical protein
MFLFCAFFSSLIAQNNCIDLKQFTSIDSLYKASNVDGTLLIFDAKQKIRYCYNSSNFNIRYSPASTFKIFNTLVAFETGIVKDSSTTISWDNKIRKPEYLNQVSRFNGTKILIRGNHDRVFTDEQLQPYFEQIIPEGDGIELNFYGIECYATRLRHGLFWESGVHCCTLDVDRTGEKRSI